MLLNILDIRFDEVKDEINGIRIELSSVKETVQSLTTLMDKLVKAVEDLPKEYMAITLAIQRPKK